MNTEESVVIYQVSATFREIDVCMFLIRFFFSSTLSTVDYPVQYIHVEYYNAFFIFGSYWAILVLLQVRHTVWYGWVQRSSLQSFGGSAGQHASNDGRMQDIRRARHRLANLLGCKDWLEVVWRATHLCSQPSANSLIENYLEPLRDILQPMGKQELQVLSEWASSNLEFRGKFSF